MNKDYLQHYGILGMKWGVRRYEDSHGHLTPLGRRRYNDYVNHLSDSEINDRIERLKKEKELKDLNVKQNVKPVLASVLGAAAITTLGMALTGNTQIPSKEFTTKLLMAAGTVGASELTKLYGGTIYKV